MTKILRPLLVSKRLPEIKEFDIFSSTVLVRFISPKIGPQFNGNCFAYCDKKGQWEDADVINKYEFNEETKTIVVEWYEEIQIESLFPDDDKSYNVAKNASGNRIAGISLHQEGQTFFKTHLLKELMK